MVKMGWLGESDSESLTSQGQDANDNEFKHFSTSAKIQATLWF